MQEYSDLLGKILKEGDEFPDASRNTTTLALFGETMKLSNLYEPNNFPIVTTKKVYFKGVSGELIWFLKGDTNIKYLVDNKINIWNDDAYNFYTRKLSTSIIPKDIESDFLKEGKPFTKQEFIEKIKSQSSFKLLTGYRLGDLGKAYGKQWRNFNSNNMIVSDQIRDILYSLYHNPFSRRHIVTAWNPCELDQTALPPCHMGFTCNIIEKNGEKYIDLAFKMRSNDFCAGNPFNIASYGLLLYVFAEILGYKPNRLVAQLDNVHVYKEHIENAKIQLERDPNLYARPDLKISDNAKTILADIASHIKAMTLNSLTLTNLIEQLKIEDFSLINYQSYDAISYEMLAPLK